MSEQLFRYVEIAEEINIMGATGNFTRARELNDAHYKLLFEEYNELLGLRRNLVADNHQADLGDCDGLIKSIREEMDRVVMNSMKLASRGPHDTNTREDQ